MKDNFRELLGAVATLVLAVSLVEITSMLFLAFTGISTSIWIFAVPSKNVDQRSTPGPQEAGKSPVESVLKGEVQL